MQNTHNEWLRDMYMIQKQQDVVKQLSKLYIIMHQNIRKTILKATIDLTYDPAPDAQQHFIQIINLLQRLRNPLDSYLAGVDPSMLNRYQRQIVDLSEQLKKLVQSHVAANAIDLSQLRRISYQDTKQKYNLKDQLKESDKRRMRTKSGQSKSSKISVMPIIAQFDTYKKEILQRKKKLQNDMANHIEMKSGQVIFSKKYAENNLNDYLQQRTQLAGLVIAQQHTLMTMNQFEDKKSHNDSSLIIDPVQKKLFSEFKIKTKLMKPRVRQNILNALADVKKQLLSQYHRSNVQKLRQGNPSTMIGLAKRSKSQGTLPQSAVNGSLSIQISPVKSKILQVKAPPSQILYRMADNKNRPFIYQAGWSQELQSDHIKSMGATLQSNRFKN